MTSRARIVLLGKYLVALSPSLTKPPSGPSPSPRRQRLHMLYLVNDILHHTTRNEPFPTFPEEIKTFLKDLFTAAIAPGAVKQLAKVERLLNLWKTQSYYPAPFTAELLAAVRDAAAGKSSSAPREKPATERPLLLPPFHGDPSLPFYDLPAANLLPHLKPNAPTPINPRLVKPIQFSTLTPSEPLAAAVKDFLASVEGMFSGADIGVGDPDAVGGLFGSAGEGEGYYGWSRSFCENMRMKKRAVAEGKSSRSEGRASRSRRRGSYSDSDRSGSYSRSRSRSRSRSGGRRRYRESRSRSPSSRSRSRSPARPSFGQSQPPLQGIPPPPPQPHLNYPPELAQQQQHYPPPQGYPPPPPPLPMPQMPYGYPQGQFWPPPPPPPPPPGFQQMMHQQFQQGYGYLWPQQPQQQQQGFPPFPPPPQPPVPQQQHVQTDEEQPQQQQQQQKSGQGGYEDYRSAKGREMGTRRGWKT